MLKIKFAAFVLRMSRRGFYDIAGDQAERSATRARAGAYNKPQEPLAPEIFCA